MTKNAKSVLPNKTRSGQGGGYPPSRESPRLRYGKELVELLQASPLYDVDIEPAREPLPVRDVEL